jgi:hypothetical protein
MTMTDSGTDLSTIFVVARGPFKAEGVDRWPGEVLFTDGWLKGRAEQMVKVLNLKPAPYDLLETWVTCDCGRLWENERARTLHHCTKGA